MASVEEVRQMVKALDFRLRESVGRRLVERHAPELMPWFNALMGYTPAAPKPILPKIQIIEDSIVQADPELSRVAYLLDLFPLYRAWLYALRRIGTGSGWVSKEDFLAGLARFQIHIHYRSLNRYLQQGNRIFWTYDRNRKRVYLRSSANVSAKLTQLLLDSRFADTLSTNKPGVRRVKLDLSGSIRQAAANAYAAWFALKQKGSPKGTMISRETLQRLWGVTTPTLLDWEELSGISKSPNFAQQSDISLDNSPKHAQLVRGRDGKLFISWQLPNTYYAPQKLEIHEQVGNARLVRDAVVKIMTDQQPAINRGQSSSNVVSEIGGSLSLGRLYFEDREQTNAGPKQADAFTLIYRHLKKHQDVYRPHYALLGKKGAVTIFERYDIATDLQLTQLWQRDMKASQCEEFVVKQRLYSSMK